MPSELCQPQRLTTTCEVMDLIPSRCVTLEVHFDVRGVLGRLARRQNSVDSFVRSFAYSSSTERAYDIE
ncbi:unnamed protein product [Soboliphyme baturini]|uniref:Uncharacterized protein n=1 Tax=Soboliphyme baturini TaxID=241478 RepID=A0A183IUU6_9BILA|nr:unnamed protein product [Soboliphyme baturini]